MKKKSTITQTMTNSPGGVQAGGNVTINQGPQPRRLTQTEVDEMMQLLHPYSGQKLYLIRLGDQEAYQFATQIIQVFQAADWEIGIADIGQQSVAGASSMNGLWLQVPEPDQLSPQARAIYSSFEHTSMPATVTDLSHVFPPSFGMRVRAENGIVLRVGLKPLD